MTHTFERLLFRIMKLMPLKIWKWYLSKINITDKSTSIYRDIFIDRLSNVRIGNKTFINHHVQLVIGKTDKTITIGNNVFFAPNVCIYCVSHNVGSSEQRAGANKYASVIIEDGTWIGANAIILPGVTVGKGSIVCAGSVVRDNIPPNEMWGGGTCSLYKKT